MTVQRFSTTLRCGACVKKVKPILDGDSRIARWKVDLDKSDKPLEVEGSGITLPQMNELLARAGYEATVEEKRDAAATTQDHLPAAESFPKMSYYPLVLILAYLVTGVGAYEVSHGAFDWMRVMNHFMAAFFLVFSFFKLLDIPAFVASYSSYDIVAARWIGYGYVYPFIELGLGLAYLSGIQPFVVNLITLSVMAVGTVGVVQSLLARRKIRCACLGAVFNLPMSFVTLVEDLLMVGMAAYMLTALPH
jgi:hypothetical protein